MGLIFRPSQVSFRRVATSTLLAQVSSNLLSARASAQSLTCPRLTLCGANTRRLSVTPSSEAPTMELVTEADRSGPFRQEMEMVLLQVKLRTFSSEYVTGRVLPLPSVAYPYPTLFHCSPCDWLMVQRPTYQSAFR